MSAPGALGSGGGSAPLPGWLGPVVTLITQVGVPTVVAGVLLWFVLFRLDMTLRQIEVAEAERVKILLRLEDSFVEALERQNVRFETVVRENIQANRDLADWERKR
jgi:hypothetical protein